MFHGAPSSRLQCTFLDEHFAEYGLRIVSPDRPGYGGSSPQPGRTLADWPADVAALADALGIDHFGVIGGSSGGPYAAVCCALLPERIIGGIITASPIPLDWPGARDHYPQTVLDIMDLLPDEDAAIAWYTDRFGADGSRLPKPDPSELPKPDAAMLADETFAQHMQQVREEALRQGIAGFVQDLLAQFRPWPFDPAQISVPVQVNHGELDTLVPIAYSHQIAQRIPGADFSELTGHGHMSVMYEWPRLISEFLQSVSPTADS